MTAETKKCLVCEQTKEIITHYYIKHVPSASGHPVRVIACYCKTCTNLIGAYHRVRYDEDRWPKQEADYILRLKRIERVRSGMTPIECAAEELRSNI